MISSPRLVQALVVSRVLRFLRFVLVLGVLATSSGCAQYHVRRDMSRIVAPTPDDCALYNSRRLERRLDRLTRSRLREGNAARLLINHDAFTARIENARDAELILVKTFIFAEDETANAIADLLSARARAGAYVVLQYDVKGSITGIEDIGDMLSRASPELPSGEKEIIRRMRDAGVKIIPTNLPLRLFQSDEWRKNANRLIHDPVGAVSRLSQTLRLFGHRDHEKYWITGRRKPDGGLELRAILGGMNIASEYAYGGTPKVDGVSGRGGWRDTDIELRGPVVNDIVDRFFSVMEYHLNWWRPNQWLRRHWNLPQPAVGKAKVRFIWNHPLVANRRTITSLYRLLIDATPAHSPLNIETAYFAPGHALRGSIERALLRGVKLTLLSNSGSSIDVKMVSQAGRQFYEQLLKYNPEVKLLERIPRKDLGEETLHSKVASFGFCGPTIVGSANLDAQSSEHNSESVVMIRDPAFRKHFETMFARDIQEDRTVRITPETVKRTPMLFKARQLFWRTVGWYWL